MTIEIATKRQDNARAADKEQTAGVGRNPPWRLPASRALYQTRACVIARTVRRNADYTIAIKCIPKTNQVYT